MKQRKTNPEVIVDAVNDYLKGNYSQREIARRLGVVPSRGRQWIANYAAMGQEAFIHNGNKHYSQKLKEQAVKDYLSGKGSLLEICRKHKIRATYQLRSWIKKYNGHEELKAFGTEGSIIMTKGRMTTFDERVKIVQYCIAHDHNYIETSAKYNVSYQQARNYTIKYETGGVEALRDRHGRTKPLDEMSELEELRAENRILHAEMERAKMEISF